MNSTRRIIAASIIFIIHLTTMSASLLAQTSSALRLTPHQITLSRGGSFSLELPEGFRISVAAEGLHRPRFMAQSPDGRIFVTDMFSRADNTRGAVYILDGFDESTGRFRRVIPYLAHLRNPNSLAFHTDRQGTTWLYLALTDHLLRYRFRLGETAPTSRAEVLATFPGYGLSYKYGGWHLTRTVVIGPDERVYVAVGSSCNACEEREEIRASVIVMDLDGSNQRFFARGLRNAVGLKWVGDELFATNMGADHLGDERPEDTFYSLREGANYGWPYCYQFRGRVYRDPKFRGAARNQGCADVPLAVTGFLAHSSPLGFDYFDASNSHPSLQDHFLVALHGSSKIGLGHGYRVVRIARGGGSPQNFILGFLQNRKIYGRPADVFRTGPNSFLVTDDYAGVIYYVSANR